MTFVFDEKDQKILDERVIARDQIDRPRVGDYLLFATGQLERISHDWGNDLQTSPSGSFYLRDSGTCEFGGGLNPAVPLEKFVLTSKQLPGEFWFFHHDIGGCGRSVYFRITCRVYITDARYEGYLGKDFQSKEVKDLKEELDFTELFSF